MDDVYQSTLPEYDVFAEPVNPSSLMRPVPEADQFQMMGRAPVRAAMSPALAAMRGLGAFGQDPAAPGAEAMPGAMPAAMAPTPVAPTPARIAISLAVLVGAGALSYQVGKALAPRGSSESLWGWIAVPAGLFTGPVGLGVMALIANRR